MHRPYRTSKVIVRRAGPALDDCRLCYKFHMKNTERWVLFRYISGQITTLSKPFKTKDQVEKARLKLPERERREVAVGVIRIKK
jgi:Zn-finger protein